MKRCKHNIDHHSMTPIGGEVFPGFDGGYVETLRCVKCGAWLSLGESNDEPEAVRVEIRAAEIAVTEDYVICPDVDNILDCEECGIHDHLCGTDPQSAAQWAGWLAREISTHNQRGSGGE